MIRFNVTIWGALAAATISTGIAAAQTRPGPGGGGIAGPRYPAACAQYLGKPMMLDCYLSALENFDIQESIFWTFPERSDTGLFWREFSEERKAQLRKTFQDMIDWHDGVRPTYAGVIPRDPPTVLNASAIQAGIVFNPVIDAEVAWNLYSSYVALQFAEEIYSWVPWSIKDLKNGQLWPLLHAQLWACFDQVPAGYCVGGGITPAHATYTYSFLKTNQLIGQTRTDTIVRMIEWCRQLRHNYGAYSHQNGFYYYHYWGEPPLSRILEGTVVDDPAHPVYATFGKQHWTFGCTGTTNLLRELLRPLNIPVEQLSYDGHSQMHFLSEGLYLGHGDDPYPLDGYSKAPADLRLAARDLLFTQGEFSSWFTPRNFSHWGDFVLDWKNAYVELKYPATNSILQATYCDDVKNGRSHADSRLYKEHFSLFYTVAEVEKTNLWQKMAPTPCN